MISCTSFGEVAALTPALQLELLKSGDPTERVWAAWSLGLQQGQDALLHLDPLKEPEAGVRRQMVIVLSSFRQRTLIKILAEFDPDARVRATACDFLIRTSNEEEKASTLTFLNHRLVEESSPEAIRGILESIPHEWPPLDSQVLRNGLHGTSSPAREGFVHYVASRLEESPGLLGLLESCLTVESEPSILVQIAQALVASASPSQIVAAAIRAPAAAPELARLLRAEHKTLDWSIVRGLVDLDDELVDLEIVNLVEEWRVADALVWLGEKAQLETRQLEPAEMADLERTRREVRWQLRNQAFNLVEDVAVGSATVLPRSFSPLLSRMIASTESYVRWLENEDQDIIVDEGIQPEVEMERSKEKLRLLQEALRASK